VSISTEGVKEGKLDRVKALTGQHFLPTFFKVGVVRAMCLGFEAETLKPKPRVMENVKSRIWPSGRTPGTSGV